MSTTHTYPWLIPIITWCWPFPFVSTNILHVKANWSLNRKQAPSALPCHHVILVASVAVAKVQVPVFSGKQSVLIELHQSGVIAWRPWQHPRSCGVFKAEFLWHTVLSNKNGEFYTYSMYLHLNRSVCLLMDRPLDEGLAFVQAGVPSCAPWWWRDAPLVREFQMWDRRCKQWDSHWFQGRKMRFCGIWSTMLRLHSVMYSVRLICTTAISLGPFCMLFTTLDDSCHCLWITVDSLWHRNETGAALDWCQLNFLQQKYLFPDKFFFFNKKNIYFK